MFSAGARKFLDIVSTQLYVQLIGSWIERHNDQLPPSQVTATIADFSYNSALTLLKEKQDRFGEKDDPSQPAKAAPKKFQTLLLTDEENPQERPQEHIVGVVRNGYHVELVSFGPANFDGFLRVRRFYDGWWKKGVVGTLTRERLLRLKREGALVLPAEKDSPELSFHLLSDR